MSSNLIPSANSYQLHTIDDYFGRSSVSSGEPMLNKRGLPQYEKPKLIPVPIPSTAFLLSTLNMVGASTLGRPVIRGSKPAQATERKGLGPEKKGCD
jgi:hypothetical protein